MSNGFYDEWLEEELGNGLRMKITRVRDVVKLTFTHDEDSKMMAAVKALTKEQWAYINTIMAQIRSGYDKELRLEDEARLPGDSGYHPACHILEGPVRRPDWRCHLPSLDDYDTIHMNWEGKGRYRQWN